MFNKHDMLLKAQWSAQNASLNNSKGIISRAQHSHAPLARENRVLDSHFNSTYQRIVPERSLH